MMDTKLSALQQLLEVVAQLRSPAGGCPWDLAQTSETLIPYIIEEAYEVVDAIKSRDPKAIAEELGDLLLQVVLQAQIASEQHHENQRFTIAEVAKAISEKLIRRHPHVFANVNVRDLAEIQQNWEQIKATETGEHTLYEKLHRYARTLPPLMATTKIINKTEISSAYAPSDISKSWEQFQKSLTSSDTSHDDRQAELGDLLFDLIALAHKYQLDAFSALQTANHRFIDNLDRD